VIDCVKRYEQRMGYDRHPVGMTMQYPVPDQATVNRREAKKLPTSRTRNGERRPQSNHAFVTASVLWRSINIP